MNALKIQVKNGRLSFDEPTELPDGTVVELHPSIEEPKKQLLWEEIKALYPDEWVILVDLVYKEPVASRQVAGGIVFARSKNKKELLQSTKDVLVGQHRACFFTGSLAPNAKLLLEWKLLNFEFRMQEGLILSELANAVH